jgi:hypothetical protein
MLARYIRGVVVDAKNDYQNRQGAKAAKIRIQKSLASLAAHSLDLTLRFSATHRSARSPERSSRIVKFNYIPHE